MDFNESMNYVAEKLLCDADLAKYKADPYDTLIGDFCKACQWKLRPGSPEYTAAFMETVDDDLKARLLP